MLQPQVTSLEVDAIPEPRPFARAPAMRRPRLYLFVLALGGAPAYGWQARLDNKVRGPQDGRDGGMCVQARPPAAWSAQGVQQAMWVSEAFYDSPARPSNVDLSGRRHGTRR